MACARCDFYLPKPRLLLEAKKHLLRLLQEIPLGEAEQPAVEDGITAYQDLLSKWVDVPTPAGPTSRQIGVELVQITSSRSMVPPAVRPTEGFGLDNRTREPQSIVHRQQGTDPQHDPHREPSPCRRRSRHSRHRLRAALFLYP
jgi:hypothetical protein